MTKLNRLANEHSLYLKQHADNPVDWYPWGEEALAQAVREDKPILLSIGYSACHWCHVMAKESFVDADTAAVMNELFINIKVDREERPDLDKIYQTVHQILTGRGGGWPLTVFLDPQDHSPFFAGTYFPVTPHYGMPAFKEVLYKLAEFFQTNREAIREHSKQLQAALSQLASTTVDKNLSTVPLEKAIQELSNQFDAVNGGFGAAPKFPHPTTLEFLIRSFSKQKSKSILEMINITLMKMAQGGIYDQLGGGFFRYSVDAKWHIPHFEKMLYDNAQLLACYVQAYLLTQNNLYADIAKQTITWLQREMYGPTGGFYATLDADSEHVEGKYYYWDREEVKKLLTADELMVAKQYFGLNQPPNFEEHWHLYVADPDNVNTEKLLRSSKAKLFKSRDKRIRPGRDEKIITAWNGLTIKGLALAGQYLTENEWIELAQTTADFIRNNLWLNKRLYATYQNNQVQHLAYLDDYAFLLDGLITLLQARWRSEDLTYAIELAEGLLTYFEDEVNGGFFFTAKDHEKLIQRPKALMDEAVPAGNGIAALALQRLGYLLGEARYLAAAKRTLAMANTKLADYPSAHCSLLIALSEHLTPPQIIILRGEDEEILQWQALSRQYYDPWRLVFTIPANAVDLPAALNQHVVQKDKVVAYICTGTQCLAPITNLTDFKKSLRTEIIH